MIELKDIQGFADEVLEEHFAEKDIYIVEISIKSGNLISILIDSFDGVSIQDCIIISKNVEKNIDREKEDFELNVSSAGLTSPFKVLKQYQKNIGNEIEVFTKTNEKLKVKLISANENEFVVEEVKMEKVEGKKRKEEVKIQHKMKYDEIRTATAIISFK